eukprot:gene13767-4736_t
MPEEAAAEEQNLWAQILEDVSKGTGKTGRQFATPKNVIVLGDEGSGKSSVIAHLQNKKVSSAAATTGAPQGVGLEYTSLDVREEDSEDVVERMGVYSLNGDQDHTTLLSAVLKKDALADLLVMLVVDLSRPWTILESLKKWSRVLAEHLDEGSMDAEDVLAELREKQVKAFQSYTEDTEDVKKEGAAEEERVLLDLDEGTLTTNFGLPIIVVGTKDDTVEFLAQDRDFRQEHFDFIQMNIRKFCLAHGASLIYTGKAQKTGDTFYRYLMHVAYGFPCTAKACIAEADGLFIPVGWDNPTKIAVLTESFTTIKTDQPYDEVVKDLELGSASGSAREAVAEDEQAFLDKQRQLLSRSEPAGTDGKPGAAPTGGSRERVARSGSGASAAGDRASRTGSASRTNSVGAGGSDRTSTRRPVTVKSASDRAARTRPTGAGTGGAASPAGAPGAPGAGGAQNADVLANFFNSLLGNNGAPGAPAPGGRPAGRADAAKELSKMQGKPE